MESSLKCSIFGDLPVPEVCDCSGYRQVRASMLADDNEAGHHGFLHVNLGIRSAEEEACWLDPWTGRFQLAGSTMK